MSKFGIWLPRSISRAVSSAREDSPEPFHVRNNVEEAAQGIDESLSHRPGASTSAAANVLPRSVYRIGRTIIGSSANSQPQSRASSQPPVPLSSAPTTSSTSNSNAVGSQDKLNVPNPKDSESRISSPQPPQLGQKTIRFPDEVDPSQAT